VRRITQWATIIAVCAFLVSVSAQMLFKIFPDPTLLEKRALSPLPTVASASQVFSDKFTTAFNDYVNDNFGFRKLFIRLNNLIDVKVFQTTSNQRVVLGKDGFLFMDYDWDSFVNRQSAFTRPQLLAAARKIKGFQDRLKIRNIEFLIVVAPNKSTIYPEYIPKQRYLLNAMSERERWFIALNEVGVNYLDLVPAILAAKKDHRMYYKGDHHWNKYASLIASQHIVSYMAEKLGMGEGAFEILGAKPDLSESAGGGSLDELLGVKAFRADEEPSVEFRGKRLPQGIVFGDSFVHWLYLNLASAKLDEIADLNEVEKFKTAIKRPDVKFVVFHLWEASAGQFMSNGIWDVAN
jgi:hypothetical protein